MPTFAVIAALPLLLAPPATDRGAASVEVAAAVEAEPPESAESPPTPAPAAAPVAQPMPVPIQPPPPPSNYLTPATPPDDAPKARKQSAPKTWPDRPIRWRVDLAGHLGTTTFFDRSWRAFDYDRKALNIGATVRGDFRLGDGRVFLGGGATFQRFASYGQIHSTLYTDILVREPLAFLRMSVVTLEGIDVFVQAGGGASIVDLYLSSTQFAEQRKVGALVDGLAGLALYLPKKWLPRRGSARATGGLELGLGYTWRSKVPVRPTVGTGDEPIDTSAAAFGNLALHGLAWRLGLFVRFQ